jgi:DNA-binding IscR family transcriptional regulator
VPKACPRHKRCSVREKLAGLQKSINDSLAKITLDEVL